MKRESRKGLSPLLPVNSFTGSTHATLVAMQLTGSTHATLVAMQLLFVCSRNRRRSLTAEHRFDGHDGHRARSAGTSESARVRVTAGMLRQADVVFVMEKRHLAQLRARFGDLLDGVRVVCLHIADEYEYGDEGLTALLDARVTPHLETASDDDEP